MNEWEKDSANPKNRDDRDNTLPGTDKLTGDQEIEEAFEDEFEDKEERRGAVQGQGAAAAKSGMPAWPWIIVSALAIAAVVFMLVRDQSGDGSMNEVVGKMEGASITKSDLYDEMAKQMGPDAPKQILDLLLTNKLIELESDKAGVSTTDADYDSFLTKIKNQMGGEEQFNAALQQYGMTLDMLKDNLKPEVQFRKLYEKQNPVTDDALKTYFEENEDQFATTPKQVRASHILVDTKEEADAILADLKAGKDFATLAKEKSKDGSKDSGGDLNFFGRGQMVPEFEEAAFALGKGELSEVVQSQFGFHIIKVTDIKEAELPAFEEKKADVKEAYLDEQTGLKRQEWTDNAKKERNVQNLLDKKDEPSPSPSASQSPAASPSASAQ